MRTSINHAPQLGGNHGRKDAAQMLWPPGSMPGGVTADSAARPALDPSYDEIFKTRRPPNHTHGAPP